MNENGLDRSLFEAKALHTEEDAHAIREVFTDFPTSESVLKSRESELDPISERPNLMASLQAFKLRFVEQLETWRQNEMVNPDCILRFSIEHFHPDAVKEIVAQMATLGWNVESEEFLWSSEESRGYRFMVFPLRHSRSLEAPGANDTTAITH